MGGCGQMSKIQNDTIRKKKMEQDQNSRKQIILIMKEIEGENEDSKIGSSNGKSQVKMLAINQPDRTFLLDKLLSSVSDCYKDVLGSSRFGLASEFKLNVKQGIRKSQTVQQSIRIQREISLLIKNLPVSHTHSIFVKCNEADTNHFTILIVGSKETPYSLGAFIFELYCTEDFPSHPPKMRLMTTGDSQVRFNPNIYVDGYICLSILGTWSGYQNEKWHESTSSILQILLSIQSLVMTDKIYYNEPCAGGQGEENNRRNQAYSNIVKLSNIRHAMIDMLRNPPSVFKEILQTHFFLQQKEIIQQCNQWISEAKLNTGKNTQYDGFVKSHNYKLATRYQSNLSLYEQDLIEETQELTKLLESIDGTELRLCAEFTNKQVLNQPAILNNNTSTDDTLSANKQSQK